MKRKDFAQRMKDIKEHVRLIDDSFVPDWIYPDYSRIIDLVDELDSLVVDLRDDLLV